MPTLTSLFLVAFPVCFQPGSVAASRCCPEPNERVGVQIYRISCENTQEAHEKEDITGLHYFREAITLAEPQIAVERNHAAQNISFHRLFTGYVVFAGLAALANLVSRYYLSDFFGISFTVAVVIAYTLGLLVNFFLNKYLNFKRHDRKTHDQLRTFVVIALGGLAVTTILSVVIKDYLLLHLGNTLIQDKETAAHVTAVGVTTFYSFFMHKWFTFDAGIRHKLFHLIRRTRDAR
jgi:putative flippase GtrA